jgi:hypothetical protein
MTTGGQWGGIGLEPISFQLRVILARTISNPPEGTMKRTQDLKIWFVAKVSLV